MTSYYKYTSKARLDKAINSLLGILEGITIDSLLNEKETGYLGKWLLDHEEYATRHPFNEILPVISKALKDNILTSEEHDEISWLCENLRSTNYYTLISADMQRLQSILAGVISDGVINKKELEGLTDWLLEHEHLKSCYPYDEVDSLITSVLADQKIDDEEHKNLLHFFESFSEIPMAQKAEKDKLQNYTVAGICAVSPSINFESTCFCFTGEAARAEREEMKIMVIDRGARVVQDVSPKVNYLIVGSKGNPCWMYACYGRKIEKAMNLRKKGHQIVIVHEVDFFDAVA